LLEKLLKLSRRHLCFYECVGIWYLVAGHTGLRDGNSERLILLISETLIHFKNYYTWIKEVLI